ncbi:hypothetical protein NVP1193O_024 [Vibrio phage 1.193.O._10N.286.52.C6]|nr:hypothetical protein NVP1193O_024 [Vibrio phage 1.193.O._10N.286.52.C6]
MTELKREDFQGTWFDVSEWTEEQKTQFQLKCFELGYKWFTDDVRVQELGASRYFLIRDCITYSTGQYYSREHEVQKQFTDIFPEYEAPKPIDVVEEIKQLFLAEMDKNTFEGDEAERGFEGLVYVETGILGASIPFKSLSEGQLTFITEMFDITETTIGKTHVTFLTTGEVYFSSPKQSDKSCYNLTFNQLFKYEDEL